jgi:uncharacterized membrane protein YphA (DoxX/SURF4 family)
MNILLWVVQVVLAALYVAGGSYKTAKADQLVKQVQALSPGAWRVIGIIEVIGGIALLIPARWMPGLTPLAAAVLAVEALLLAALYAQRSRKLTAANPLVYAVVMAVLAGCVAYGRYTLATVA